MKKIRCNNCMRIFEDENELEFFESMLFYEDSFLGCPDCETDEYLMDIE